MMYKDFFCAMSLSHISVIMADSILRLTDLKKDVPCEFQNDEVGKRKNDSNNVEYQFLQYSEL